MIARSQGMSLIESLIALLLLSLGILGMVGMYARAASASGDAQYRVEAAAFAGELAQQIAGSVTRAAGVVTVADLNSFTHQPGGTPCAATGQASGNPLVTNWIQRIGTARTGLPGAAAATFQQIRVETGANDFNRVTITVCWQGPSERAPSRHELITHVN